MRNLLYLIVIVLLFSCEQVRKKQRDIATKKESKFTQLLTKYKNISFDTLKVFSSESLESNQYRFKGIQLDSAEVSLFPKDISEQYINDNGFFACYKFSIDSTRTGLITRTPSTYEPSSIKLLILNRQKDAITEYIELAETFGDAGDMAEKVSWLFKDHNKKFASFIWVEESHDNSVDDENDTTIQIWNYYYLLDISKHKVDTVSKNEVELEKKFKNLVNQKASR